MLYQKQHLAIAWISKPDSAEDNLMNARSAYRAALKQQTGNDSKIISLQSDLEDAQYCLQKV